ncbi:hypothetical protein ACVWXO_003932 [Bradyrhizobium sp. LM2.7]
MSWVLTRSRSSARTGFCARSAMTPSTTCSTSAKLTPAFGAAETANWVGSSEMLE